MTELKAYGRGSLAFQLTMLVGSMASPYRHTAHRWSGTPRGWLGAGEERLEGSEDVAAVDVLERLVVERLLAPLDDRRVVLASDENLDDGGVVAVDFTFVAESSPAKARASLLGKIE